MAMDNSGLPSVLTVAGRIPCVDTRYCLEYLINGQITAKLETAAVLTALQSMHSDIKDIKNRDAESPRLFSIPPEIINAMSRGSSASSGLSGRKSGPSSSSSSRSQSRRKRVRDDGLIWVRCPFCVAEHWNEKSHLQHVSRSLER